MIAPPPVAPAARCSRFRGGRLVVLLAASLFGVATAQPREPGAPQRIAAPHYGAVLFDFYQDRTFTALTGLMASQHFARLAPHDDEAEILRGGMLLSYGLHDEAGALFARLIERHADAAVRDRAWYFLARARHQRGLSAAAEEALARIAAPLPGALEDERQLLRAQLLMQRQAYDEAAAVLQALQGSPTAGLYARFNLGVALVKSGSPEGLERGQALLDALGQVPAADEEARSLRDRANVALGFAALQAQRPREARVALQRVRLDGLQSNKALLGYGWAAAELNDPKLALVPWSELAGRAGADAAVLEARLAVPYALGELGAYGQALQGYEQAAAGFGREQAALADSIAAVQAGKLVAALLALNPGEGLAAWAGIRTLPEMPHAAHMVPLLAANEVQEAFKNLRDLQFLEQNLQHWHGNLGVYGDMLDQRRRTYAERASGVRVQAQAVDIAALQQRRDALAAELARAVHEDDGAVFADAREEGLRQRIERARQTLQRVASEPGAAAAPDTAERLRRAAGALTWQLMQELPERRWAAHKGLRDTDQALHTARASEADLAQAQRDEPARHARLAERIAELARRLDALLPQVTALGLAQQQQLQAVAVAELEQQQERLVVYAAQARLAIAQIHDRAQFARHADAPPQRDGAASEAPR